MTSDPTHTWREIVARSLDWKEAHATFDDAIADLAPDLRGKRATGFPHSVWELVEHIRIAQEDLADFMESPDYPKVKWPEGYWPSTPTPPSDAAWEASIGHVRHDNQRLKDIAMRASLDLTARVPWGDGQTYLRTILVAVDHTAYHVGQIIALRRLIGSWPSA